MFQSLISLIYLPVVRPHGLRPAVCWIKFFLVMLRHCSLHHFVGFFSPFIRTKFAKGH